MTPRPAPPPARSATCTPPSWTRPGSASSGSTRSATTSTGPSPSRIPATLLRQLGGLQRRGSGARSSSTSMTDKRDSTRYMPYLEQCGIGLPDESYYREDRSPGSAQEYTAHIGRMLGLAGIRRRRRGRADSWRWRRAWRRRTGTGSRSRDAVATYNAVDRNALQELTPGLDWAAWLEGVEAPASVLDEVVVRQPDFFTALAKALDAVPIGGLGALAGLARPRGSAPYLSDDVRRRELRLLRPHPDRRAGAEGALEARRRRRWSRRSGEAVGKLYVERHFPPEAKERMKHARRQPGRGLPAQHRAAGLDERRDQGARPGQARQVHPEDRLPRPVARLLRAGGRPPTTCSATSAPARPSRPTASWPSSAARSTATSGT